MDYKKETIPGERFHTDPSSKSMHKTEEDLIFFHTLAKKSEKIVTALYMVTDYMNVDEPIRNKLRNHGVELVSDMASVAAMPGLKKESSFLSIAGRISEIFSFMDIAASIGLVSDMNYRILKGEMISLKESLSKRQESYRINIFEDLFLAENTQKDIKGQFVVKDTKRQIKSPSDFKEETVLQNLSFKNSKDQRNNFNNEERNQSSETARKYLKERRGFGSENSTRKDMIVGLIKDKGEVTIKDISCAISECSEKTIQRELLSLVNSSVLKKTGEKRWSRYSLNAVIK